jgi:hypothetical protein
MTLVGVNGSNNLSRTWQDGGGIEAMVVVDSFVLQAPHGSRYLPEERAADHPGVVDPSRLFCRGPPIH